MFIVPEALGQWFTKVNLIVLFTTQLTYMLAAALAVPDARLMPEASGNMTFTDKMTTIWSTFGGDHEHLTDEG